MCDFSYNTNFDSIDATGSVIVCILQNALNKFCPINKVKWSYDVDKLKSWLANKIKSLMKEKKENCIIIISGSLCLMVTSIALFELGLII